MSEPALGRRIVLVSRAGTAAFTVTAVAAVIDRAAFGLLAAGVAFLLFVVGCIVFLWAYGVAVSRSRVDAMGIGGLFFLQGSAPRRVQVDLLVPLGIQTAVALTTAALRPFTSLAFGVLVPMFGLAQAGLWGARYGTFGPRVEPQGPGAPPPGK